MSQSVKKAKRPRVVAMSADLPATKEHRPKAARRPRKSHRQGTLFVIGGHEDRHGVHGILKEFARFVGRGKLVVATVASAQSKGVFHDYVTSFREAGVRKIEELIIRERKDALNESSLGILKNAKGVFFTGGDQLRVTSHLGGSPVHERIREIYHDGGVIGGTSAGASIVADNMLVKENSPPMSSTITDATLEIIPGLSLLHHVIIDQHFTQRDRLGRLMGAVCRNPASLGLGLDENTGAVFHGHDSFHVVGAGAVYVVDAQDVTFSNFADETTGMTMSVYNLRMHVLSQGDAFDLSARLPHRLSPQKSRRLHAMPPS